MVKIADAIDRELVWSQPRAMKQAYELQAAGELAVRSDEDLAAFTNLTWKGGGTLVFANGRRCHATTNFWNTNFELKAEDEQPLIRFHYGASSASRRRWRFSRKRARWPSCPC